jgi:sulfatase modifying factor 1
MRIKLVFILTVLILAYNSCSRREAPENMVFVKGGKFVNTKSNLYTKNVKIPDFYIGKYEVTQKEWIEVMGNNPSTFKGGNLPVEGINWYECIEYCNKRSIKEGLKPYYTINKNKKDPCNKNDKDEIKWTVTVNRRANGYRLPTEQEWEYAAGGGQLSKNYTYSGSNVINEVAWFWQNSGDKLLSGFWHYKVIEANDCKTKPVGAKAPNELGIHDMSGNVRVLCWDWYGKSLNTESGDNRVLRGGGWLGGDFCCESAYRTKFEPYQKRARDVGFRICRNK